MTDASDIIELRNLSKSFGPRLNLGQRLAARLGRPVMERRVHAVDRVNLTVRRGEVLGLVGESGCGKSTLGRMMTGIIQPSTGDVLFNGKPMQDMDGAEAHEARLKVQMIFQNPYASLNPRLRVEKIVGEAPLIHGLSRNSAIADYVDEQLRRTGLDPEYKRRFPHQFSGGQRQRVGIARALAVQPDVIVCDESVAALDVSIQAQIINLFMELRRQLNLTYVFISHDLGVVRHLSDRVAIMYLGRIVEQGTTADIYGKPNHPYTQALLAQVPRLDVRKSTFVAIKGEIPSPLNPPSGCHFHPRCPHAMDVCRRIAPALTSVGNGHISACHLNTKANAEHEEASHAD